MSRGCTQASRRHRLAFIRIRSRAKLLPSQSPTRSGDEYEAGVVQFGDGPDGADSWTDGQGPTCLLRFARLSHKAESPIGLLLIEKPVTRPAAGWRVGDVKIRACPQQGAATLD